MGAATLGMKIQNDMTLGYQGNQLKTMPKAKRQKGEIKKRTYETLGHHGRKNIQMCLKMKMVHVVVL